ncbi:MAG: zinc metallopeptidase [Bacteroidia bacterium]|nr:zinc metallopeptidase [Bacteroidia bacterium]
MAGIYLIGLVFLGLSMLVSWRFKSKFTQFSQEALSNGLSGAEIAERMLRENNIYDVKVISTEGQLTDHYNPENKTVNLSNDVFYGRSVAAAAVAAHECGHAVQHATAYTWLTMRSKLVPLVSISSRYMQWIILGGILLINTTPVLLEIGVALFAATTIFTFITLPVEFDASNRAVAWLTTRGMVRSQEETQVRESLRWAAMTYVVAALSSLATLLYYISILNGRSRD